MLKYIFLVLYLIAAGTHVYGSFVYNKKIRNITKPMLMLLLALFYVSVAEHFEPLVLVFILTSWVGDVFLMKHGMKWLTLGGIGFFFTHVFLVVLYCRNIVFSKQLFVIIPVYLAMACGIIISMFRRLKRYMPKSNLAMLLAYLCCNLTMNMFAAMQAASGQISGGTLILMGATLFLASDSLLYMIRFDKKVSFYGKHANVMLTYTVAKLLIVLGFLA